MIVTERDRQALLCLARYGLLNRRQLQRLCFPTDKDGRITRRRLAILTEEGFIHRHTMLVASQYEAAPAPVYLLSKLGCQWIAEELGDDRFLHKRLKVPHALHLHHQLAVSETYMTLDAAIATQDAITLEAWINEMEVVNADEPDSGKHFRLFTELRMSPRLVCTPDAAFMLGHRGQLAVFYLEQDRGNGDRGTGTRQLANRKAPGYTELVRRQLQRKHFPAATTADFTVLLIVLGPQRRDALRRAFRQLDSATHRTDLWRFVARMDLIAETFLHEEIFYRCEDEPPGPLIRQ